MSFLSTAPGQDAVGRAIILNLITVGAFGIQDALSKLLVQDYSPFQIVMMRYWGFAIFALIIVARQAPLREALRSRMPKRQVLRGVLLIVDIWAVGLALRTLQLGELQSIVMAFPLLVTLFAIPILGEKVGVFRLTAVGVGFLGVLLIVRPGGVPLDWGLFFAAFAAATYALYIVVTRQVSAVDSAATSLTYSAVVGVVMATGVGVFFWQPLDWASLGMVGLTVITTCAGHGMMVYALSMAPASTLQPFNYFALPWAIVLSILIFGQGIDPISLLGAGIIVAAGLVVMARERAKNASVMTEAAAMTGRE